MILKWGMMMGYNFSFLTTPKGMLEISTMLEFPTDEWWILQMVYLSLSSIPIHLRQPFDTPTLY